MASNFIFLKKIRADAPVIAKQASNQLKTEKTQKAKYI